MYKSVKLDTGEFPRQELRSLLIVSFEKGPRACRVAISGLPQTADLTRALE